MHTKWLFLCMCIHYSITFEGMYVCWVDYPVISVCIYAPCATWQRQDSMYSYGVLAHELQILLPTSIANFVMILCMRNIYTRIYIYMCVCVCICVCYFFAFDIIDQRTVHTRIAMHTSTHLLFHAYIYIYIYIYACIHVCMYVCAISFISACLGGNSWDWLFIFL
jgi:hypothetical protein